MKEMARYQELAENMLGAWNTQDVERVLECYTEDVHYLDPNTRGAINGADPMRRYLRKLFLNWTMHWEARQIFPLHGVDGASVAWRATFAKPGGALLVEAMGMDLVLFSRDRISRNEVYFDRSVLAPFLAQGLHS